MAIVWSRQKRLEKARGYDFLRATGNKRTNKNVANHLKLKLGWEAEEKKYFKAERKSCGVKPKDSSSSEEDKIDVPATTKKTRRASALPGRYEKPPPKAPPAAEVEEKQETTKTGDEKRKEGVYSLDEKLYQYLPKGVGLHLSRVTAGQNPRFSVRYDYKVPEEKIKNLSKKEKKLMSQPTRSASWGTVACPTGYDAFVVIHGWSWTKYLYAHEDEKIPEEAQLSVCE